MKKGEKNTQKCTKKQTFVERKTSAPNFTTNDTLESTAALKMQACGWQKQGMNTQAAEADLRWKMNLVLTFEELHLPSSVNITYLNKSYKNYSSNNSLEFFSHGRVQKGESPECTNMEEAASMPRITKHKVLLCVVCCVSLSCCNRLWRYFTALNEKNCK